MQSTPVLPAQTLLQGKVYVPAARTDIRETWLKFGWTPVQRPVVPQ